MTADQADRAEHEPRRLDGTEDLPVLTINEAAAAYPDEWIFMLVTQKNERGLSSAGKVLLHNRSRKALADDTVALLKDVRKAPPDALAFYTYKGPRFDSREEWLAYQAKERAAHDGRP
jgi:hypothetical protein